jgi:hypothetical protein
MEIAISLVKSKEHYHAIQQVLIPLKKGIKKARYRPYRKFAKDLKKQNS